MKKLLTCLIVGVVAWMAASVAWAVTARTTGIPGPTRAAHASVDAAAGAVEAVDLPRLLSYPQRAVAHRMRAGGRAIVRLYALPERIASRVVGRSAGEWRWHHARIDSELCAAPVPALEAAARAIETEIGREVRARLETRRGPEAPRRPGAPAIVVRIES